MPRTTPSADKAPVTPGEFYRADDYRPEESVGFLMRQIMSSVLSMADRRLAEHDLTHAQWVPLFKLYHGDCATMAELARTLQQDPAAMTRALDRLEAKGLVQRTRSSSDRRVQNLELTDLGREVAAVVPAVLSDILNQHLAGFSEKEWRSLVQLLQRMRANGDALRQAEADGP
jgi:DNA-binding MarR family transcriptional regulator